MFVFPSCVFCFARHISRELLSDPCIPLISPLLCFFILLVSFSLTPVFPLTFPCIPRIHFLSYPSPVFSVLTSCPPNVLLTCLIVLFFLSLSLPSHLSVSMSVASGQHQLHRVGGADRHQRAGRPQPGNSSAAEVSPGVAGG